MPRVQGVEEQAERLQREPLLLQAQDRPQAVPMVRVVQAGATAQDRVGEQAEGLQRADAPGGGAGGGGQAVDGQGSWAGRLHLTMYNRY